MTGGPAVAAKHAIAEAKRGDPGHLIGRVLNRSRLTDDEIQYLVELLEATESKQTRARTRDLEKWLIAKHFDSLVDEEGMKPKCAMDVVMKDRDCRVRKIRTALKAYGKPRRCRG